MHKKGERTLLFELQNEAEAEVVVDEAVIVPFARSDGAVNGVALPTAARLMRYELETGPCGFV